MQGEIHPRRPAAARPWRLPAGVRLAAMALWLSLLAGCFETEALSGFGARPAGASGPNAVSVLGGAVTIAGPDGWCINEGATREGAASAFVLMQRCRAGVRAVPVIGIVVADMRVPEGDRQRQLENLAEFLVTDAGRGQLSRRGRSGDVTIAAQRQHDGALWLHLSDTGNPEQFLPEYLRVVMPLAGRLVTVSALSLQGAPVSAANAEAVMAEVIAVLRRRNLD